jgi:hypothetical protein
MDSVKYIGLDVHKDAIVIAVLNNAGKLVSGVNHSFRSTTIRIPDLV